jgi:hypothetical protein
LQLRRHIGDDNLNGEALRQERQASHVIYDAQVGRIPSFEHETCQLDAVISDEGDPAPRLEGSHCKVDGRLRPNSSVDHER